MPGASSFQTGMLKQKAVLWLNPVNDGYGGRTFDDPAEIDCRWEDLAQTFVDASGREAVSRAVVYVDRDVAPGAYLMLGEVADLDSDSAGPDSEPDAREVRSFSKIPSVSGTLFCRKVWLV